MRAFISAVLALFLACFYLSAAQAMDNMDCEKPEGIGLTPHFDELVKVNQIDRESLSGTLFFYYTILIRTAMCEEDKDFNLEKKAKLVEHLSKQALDFNDHEQPFLDDVANVSAFSREDQEWLASVKTQITKNLTPENIKNRREKLASIITGYNLVIAYAKMDIAKKEDLEILLDGLSQQMMQP